jgi:hypothetical protein
LDQFVFSECELLRSTSEQRLNDLSQFFSIVCHALAAWETVEGQKQNTT